MTTEVTRALVTTFYGRLWNAWDDAAVDTTLGPEFGFRGSLGTQTRGRAEWRTYRNMVRTGAPDFHNEVVQLVCEGERAAAQLVCTGTHLGPVLDIDATGRQFRYAVAAFFTCRDGWIVEATALGDLVDLRRQLERDS